MKTLIFGLIASVAITSAGLAGNASAHGRDDQGTGVSAQARAGYAYAPRPPSSLCDRIGSGQMLTSAKLTIRIPMAGPTGHR